MSLSGSQTHWVPTSYFIVSCHIIIINLKRLVGTQWAKPDVVNLSETELRAKNKVKLDGFLSFNKNRVNKVMGGVATSVVNDFQQFWWRGKRIMNI